MNLPDSGVGLTFPASAACLGRLVLRGGAAGDAAEGASAPWSHVEKERKMVGKCRANIGIMIC